MILDGVVDVQAGEVDGEPHRRARVVAVPRGTPLFGGPVGVELRTRIKFRSFLLARFAIVQRGVASNRMRIPSVTLAMGRILFLAVAADGLIRGIVVVVDDGEQFLVR